MSKLLALWIFLFLLIFIHELGHFLMARLFKVQVKRFAVGFGPCLLRFSRAETNFEWRLLPFGGMVKMTGEDPGEAATLSAADFHKSYHHLRPWKRMLIAVGGPIFNIVPALLLVALLQKGLWADSVKLKRLPLVVDAHSNEFILTTDPQKRFLKIYLEELDEQSLGGIFYLHESLGTKTLRVYIRHLNHLMDQGFYPLALKIDHVEVGSLADRMDIRPGDVIVGVNGERLKSFEDIVKKILAQEGTFSLRLLREGQLLELDLNSSSKKIGIHSAGVYHNLQGKRHAPVADEKNNVEITSLFLGLLRDYQKLFSGEFHPEQISGPLMIGKVVTAAMDFGLATYLFILAVISINLGLINLLPIPILDGGHVFLCFYEMLTKRRPGVRGLKMAFLFGRTFIIILTTGALFNDIMQLFF
ncbi:MAG TPA: RIP metalloprotease RseP [Bdellovibrionales bacterium]|nr:RIP metalloprotease RseP [Bdellovibrionales bacterium]